MRALAVLASLMIAAGCSKKPPAEKAAPQPPVQTPAEDDNAPAFERLVEAGDIRVRVHVPHGQAASEGSFVVDIDFEGGAHYTDTQERDGEITDVWLTDVTADSYPDLVVTTTSSGSGGYGSVFVYKNYREGWLARSAADLTDAQQSGYMGHDRFAIENGVLVRRFPLYRDGDPNAAPSGGLAVFAYDFESDRWNATP
jgi:hypothetical protein